MGNSIIYLDIMLNGRFVRQLGYSFCPLFPIKLKEVKKYIDDKCPSLKGKNYKINFSNQKV